MGHHFRYLGAALAIALAVVLPAFAQQQTGYAAIEGTVFDGGTPLRGAVVTATNLKSGFSRSATTDVYGHYIIGQLAEGKYEIKVTHAGYVTKTFQGPVPGYGVVDAPRVHLTRSSP